MIVDWGFAPLSHVATGLAASVPATQHLIEEQYLRNLRDFLPVAETARLAGLDELAVAVAPPLLTISAAEIQVSLAAGFAQTQSFEVGFRIINAGFHTSFRSTQKVTHSLRIEIAASEFFPGAAIDEEIESPPER
jgi:hypothetical protein